MGYLGTSSGRLGDLADLLPQVGEGDVPAPTHGIQRMLTVPLGAPLLVNATTYKNAIFVAPCDGCYIKELWITAAVAIAGGTNTLAVDNYDASANSARNVLSTTNIDPTTVTAKEGLQLTLSSTDTNLYMDEGDVINATLVCGTMTTPGEGYVVTAIVIVPEIA